MPTVHREIQIVPEPPQTPHAFLDAMEQCAGGSWRRGDFLHVINPDRPVDSAWAETEAFHREVGDSIEMVVFSVGDWELTLVDALCSTRDLSVEAYNQLAGEFFNEVVEAALQLVPASVSFDEAFQPLEEHLTAESLDKLKRFSGSANKASSALHSLDRERWCDFLITAFRCKDCVQPSLLKGWLIEEEGWPPEIAVALTEEFSFSQLLLERYSREVDG